jgi:hypothetical protein
VQKKHRRNKMEKIAKTEVTLKNGMVVTIENRRSITVIEGDAWEGKPTETLYINDTKISFIDQNGKKHCGNGISKLYPSISKDDAEFAKKGAVASISNTPMYLGQESYDVVNSAFESIQTETMMPEWAEHFDAIAKKETEKKIAKAKKIIEEGDKEIKSLGKLLTDKEVNAWRKNYNNINNEGGDGFIPSRISQEEYDGAKKIINA